MQNEAQAILIIYFILKPVKDISALDLNASLGNFQEIIIYDEHNNKLFETSNDNTVRVEPKVMNTVILTA